MKTTGVYTNEDEWSSIVGSDYSGGASQQLWYFNVFIVLFVCLVSLLLFLFPSDSFGCRYAQVECPNYSFHLSL